MIGLISCSILIVFKRLFKGWLVAWGWSETVAETVSKLGPLVAVLLTAATMFFSGIHGSRQVAIVGEIPPGLPGLTWPDVSPQRLMDLLPLALIMTLVGYLESISVAKALASRRREKVDPNQELLALGAADVGAAFTGGYPVTGGFSRSLVNFTAGARTPIASVITAGLVALSVAVLTPMFFHIPKAVLAAIIVVAVSGLVDFSTPLKLWAYCKPDAIALLVTFASVLGMGIETGVLVGIAATVVMQMWKTSRPHIAEVGRLGESEHFRNVLRHDVRTVDRLLAFRVDEAINFSNAPFLEDYVHDRIAERKNLQHVLLIGSGINDIDSTGIEVLEHLREELQAVQISFYLSEIKGPVMDRLIQAGFDPEFLDTHVFLSTHEAFDWLEAKIQEPDQRPEAGEKPAAAEPS